MVTSNQWDADAYRYLAEKLKPELIRYGRWIAGYRRIRIAAVKA